LDIKLVGREQLGTTSIVKVSGLATNFKPAQSHAECNGDEIASGGGFDTTGLISKSARSANGWYAMAGSEHNDFQLQDNVQCIKIEVGTKPLTANISDLAPLLTP
jgi:hypothetical protein